MVYLHDYCNAASIECQEFNVKKITKICESFKCIFVNYEIEKEVLRIMGKSCENVQGLAEIVIF